MTPLEVRGLVRPSGNTLGEVPDATDPSFGVTGWPPPDVPETVNKAELGNLSLTAEEEAAFVAFLKMLSDDTFSQDAPSDRIPLHR